MVNVDLMTADDIRLASDITQDVTHSLTGCCPRPARGYSWFQGPEYVPVSWRDGIGAGK